MADAPRISAALIVKNGARTLGNCLASLQSAADEIVVVDTGSSDNSRDVARDFGARIFDFAWTADFAAARQFAFDQATGDWVFWVDADDVVLHAENIRPLVESASDETGVFYWPYIYARDTSGNSLVELWRERCVRNDGSFTWCGRVHETLTSDRHWKPVRSDRVVVEHQKESREARGPEAGRRNLDILETEYRAAGDRADARTVFYLARERADTGDTRGAIRAYREYVRVGTWDPERYMAQTQIAALYRRLRRYPSAIRADLDALTIRPELPHAYFGLAESYYYLEDWPKVRHWADLGRCMPEPDLGEMPLTYPMVYRYDWIIYYTNALYHLGDLDGALEWTRKALAMRPDDESHRANMEFFSG